MEKERILGDFIQHGKKGDKVEIPADDVLNAIAEGRGINIKDAIIKGNLNVDEIAGLDWDEDNKLIIPISIKIRWSEIHGNAGFASVTFSKTANFTRTTFNEDAYFDYATFGKYVSFNAATFKRNADFSFANFDGKASFIAATFNTGASFSGVTMEHPANFADVHFRENTVRKRLWDYILRPVLWFITIGKVKLSKKPITDFSGFNTTTVMDASSNPYLKRYIDDEQWIASWRQRSWVRRWPLFILWEIMSHCGKSFILWAGWSVSIALIFGFIYWWRFGCDSIAFNVDKLNGIQPGFLDYLYYSVVTFTTLGFGDIVPLTVPARIVVGLEVVLGYVMLGGLISIFANKFARRS